MRAIIICVLVVVHQPLLAQTGWFDEIYTSLDIVQFDFDAATEAINYTGIEISPTQYNSLIGSKTPFIFSNGDKIVNVVYGEMSNDNLIEGLNMPKVYVLGKMDFDNANKYVLVKIQEDARFEPLPMIILYSFDENDCLLSALLLSSGSTSSVGSKVTENGVTQITSYEGGYDIKKYSIRQDGYFELISEERN